jgi:hypothetical protein
MDGPFPIRIDGKSLLEKAGVEGVLDCRSLRVADLNLFPQGWGRDTIERECAVQFESADDFHPERNPKGTLWMGLYKYTWENRSFPRKFRLYFDTIRQGGKPSASAEKLYWLKEAPVLSHDPVSHSLAWNEPQNGQQRAVWKTPEGQKPHFHPLTTPTGRLLTHDSPRDHLWHHGLCLGWTEISCPGKSLAPYSYWGEPGLGHIWPEAPKHVQSGSVWSGFTQSSFWGSQSGESVMRSDLSIRFAQIDPLYDWIDLDLTLTAEDEAVELKTEYGHWKVRMNLAFESPDIVDSTSNSNYNRGYRDPTPVDWIGFHGMVDGAPAGLMLIDHPENPGLPSSGDGSCDVRTFPGEKGDLFGWIGLNPMRTNALNLAPGESLRFRNRVVLADRMLDPDFTEPMAATFRNGDPRLHWL